MEIVQFLILLAHCFDDCCYVSALLFGSQLVSHPRQIGCIDPNCNVRHVVEYGLPLVTLALQTHCIIRCSKRLVSCHSGFIYLNWNVTHVVESGLLLVTEGLLTQTKMSDLW